MNLAMLNDGVWGLMSRRMKDQLSEMMALDI